MISCKNPYAVDNVNVAQGPKTGNADAHTGKRGDFLKSKSEREASAAEIERAFAQRQERDFADYNWDKEGEISPNTRARNFKSDTGGLAPHRRR